MAKTEVGIIFRAYDQTSGQLGKIGAGMDRFKRQLAGVVAGYLSFRAVTGAVKAVTSATMAHQEAEMGLAAALGRTGDATSGNMSQLESYANALQRVTRYGNDEITSQMELAKNMGLATPELGRATKAAIGLSAAYRMDLAAAYRIVTLAAAGETGQLKERGIVLDKNLTTEQKYNEVLRIGEAGFRIAVEQTKTATGAAEQLNNTWVDTKKIIGEELKPVMESFFKGLNTWLEDNQPRVEKWTKTWREGFLAIKEGAQWLTPTDRNPPVWNQIKALPDRDETALWDAYRQHIKERKVTEDLPYLEKLADSYKRNRARMNAADAARANAPAVDEYGLTMPSLTGAGQTFVSDEEEKAAVQKTIDMTAAWRRMAGDMNRTSERGWQVRKELLVKEFEEYNRVVDDHLLVWDWFQERQTDMRLEYDQARGTFLEGFGAGIAEMNREMQTMGELGADVGRIFKEGIVDSLTDALMEAKNLNDVMRAVGMDIARTTMHWGVEQFVTAALVAFTKGAVKSGGSASANPDPGGELGHAAGTIIDRPIRWWADGGLNVAGEKGPEGLLPLTRGPGGRLSVQSVGGGGMGRRQAAEMIDLLRKLAERQSVVVIDKREDAATVLSNDAMRRGPLTRLRG